MESKSHGSVKGRLLLSWETDEQRERERDCTAKSKEKKHGLPSQVIERDS